MDVWNLNKNKKKSMTTYYVSNNASWFLVKANTKQKAINEGVKDYGRISVKAREATQAEIRYFKNIKGEDAIEELD